MSTKHLLSQFWRSQTDEYERLTARQVLRRIWWIGLVTMLVVRCVLLVVMSASTFVSIQEGYGLESYHMQLIDRSSRGATLYTSSQEMPYLCNDRPPLFFWLAGTMKRWSGFDLETSVIVVRAISLFSFLLLTCAVLTLLADRYGLLPAAVGGIAFAGSLANRGYGVIAGPEMFADMLGAIGFMILTAGFSFSFSAGTILLVLAFLSNQVTWPYMLAGCLTLVWQDRRRSAFYLAGIYVVAIGALVGFFTMTGQSNLALSMVRGVSTNHAFVPFVQSAYRLLWFMPDLLVLMVIAKTHLLKRDQAWADEWGLWMSAAIVTLLGMARVDADWNTFFVARLMAAVLYARITSIVFHPDYTQSKIGFVPTLSLSLALVIACFGSFRIADMTVRNQPVGEDDQMRQSAVQLADISKLVRDAKGKVFTDVPRLNMLLQEHATLGHPRLVVKAHEAGRIDIAPLQKKLASREFELVVLSRPIDRFEMKSHEILPRPIIDTLLENYRYKVTVGGYAVYLPNQKK